MLGRLRDEQQGMLLMEVVLTATLTLVVMAFALNVLSTSSQSQRRTTARAEVVTQVQTGIARLMREMHQAAAFNFLTSQLVDVNSWVRGGAPGEIRRVRYDCSQAQECRRYEGPVDQPLPTTYSVLATGVLNADVFAPEPDLLRPTWVGVRLRLSIEGSGEPATITDGASLPNVNGR